MAEDNEDQENNEEGAGVKEKKPLNPKVKLIIIIVAALLVVVATVGGTLYMLGFFDTSDSEELEVDEEVAEAVVDNKPSPAMYFPIKPAFIVNYPDKGRQRYLQVEVTVLTRDMDVFNAMQIHSPLIKNRLVMLLGGEVYQELQTAEGKELLRQKVLEAMQGIMEQELGKTGIEEVLFTNFVMQ
ncbi:flagellar basal body-associated FliL family protein [Oceanicoccus sp. KOV_DT_Chl]|uniref:flagellar basal body-associated FliL family protein n=1 Tax=Oceanicoccus sp. KOV_DT_Chl TaxID=1904639 RepID=UPI000C7CCCFD|nr:flagellar basal body-associated FliL family protein [Oceanicoccus sp. KOV_DT_Chl]